MLGVIVDWTQVLIVGVPAYIAALFAGVATLLVARTHRALQTPSGDAIGHVVERTHETSIANNMLLRQANGETEKGTHRQLSDAGEAGPQVPVTDPPYVEPTDEPVN